MSGDELSLRVSVATLARVVFPHDGATMLALERKATLRNDTAYVVAQPFGGAVRLLNVAALHDLIGAFRFDSDRSRAEQDFRILIRPADWSRVKAFCLHHLRRADDPALETDPERELIEELAECLQVTLKPTQFTYRSIGIAIEDTPTPTDNIYSQGVPTVRLYSIFEVMITDTALCLALLNASERHTDAALGTLAVNNAQSGGRGRANSVLTIPLDSMTTFYRIMSPDQRYGAVNLDGHPLDPSVLAILDSIDVPQLQRL
ncbi:MAG: hypothetical protein KF716_08315 [Anaerolineae bacterium]|nr:hypothetical protein [Anaerolineae bacterium]